MRAIYVSLLFLSSPLSTPPTLSFLLASSFPLITIHSPKPLSRRQKTPVANTPDDNNPPHNPIFYRLPPPPPHRILNIQSLNLPPKLLSIMALHLLNIPKIPRIMRISGRRSFHLVFPFRPESAGTEEMERA
jgi:hypothetical protein